MKHLALDEIQITPQAEPAPARSSEVLAFIAREGRKLQINHLICAAYATRRVNGVEDSRSTPKVRRAR
ncbi:hypothetical protein [Rhodococcus erythropolis]|uniref:Transposase n=1 Tax=Rhodococcus erythropolis TaxID=1833 RepID=A0AAX3ZZ12_RHOER|nr:hypothetical protein [Rhodococcus erythropolis]WMN03086.1 hypothetical protein QIE55_32270 [Rhodococcus erythropolis]